MANNEWDAHQEGKSGKSYPTFSDPDYVNAYQRGKNQKAFLSTPQAFLGDPYKPSQPAVYYRSSSGFGKKLVLLFVVVVIGFVVYTGVSGVKESYPTQNYPTPRAPQYRPAPQAPSAAVPRGNRQTSQPTFHVKTPAEAIPGPIDNVDAGSSEQPSSSQSIESDGPTERTVEMTCTQLHLQLLTDENTHDSAAIATDAPATMNACKIAASDGTDAGAMIAIGSMYEQGVGVPKDTEQAIYWYRQAADVTSYRQRFAAGLARTFLKRLGTE